MRNVLKGITAMAVVTLLTLAASAQPPQTIPQQQVVWTKVSLTELHCNGCLKKISNVVGTVPGVVSVQGDLPSKTVFVASQPGVAPAPKALWEAFTKADHTPIRMEGPAGTFTAKP